MIKNMMKTNLVSTKLQYCHYNVQILLQWMKNNVEIIW